VGYLGCSALGYLLVGVLTFTAVSALLTRFAPQVEKALAGLSLLLAVSTTESLVILLVLNVVKLLQLHAVWRGYRWGAYGLALILLSELALTVIGGQTLVNGIKEALSVLVLNIPLLALFFLLRAKWSAMR